MNYPALKALRGGVVHSRVPINGKPMPQTNIVKVFGEYKERLVSFVCKRLAVKDEAEDIVQEIFYQLSRVNDAAKPIEQTAAWLFRVARNMIINWHKKKRIYRFLCWQLLMKKMMKG